MITVHFKLLFGQSTAAFLKVCKLLESNNLQYMLGQNEKSSVVLSKYLNAPLHRNGPFFCFLSSQLYVTFLFYSFNLLVNQFSYSTQDSGNMFLFHSKLLINIFIHNRM